MTSSSYDPRMDDLPVIISYPRSGSNWLNSIMELYFNRPRLRISYTSLIKDDGNYMWFHDHDTYSDLKLSHNNILYLYRDPCDVIFSLAMVDYYNDPLDSLNIIKLIDKEIYLLKQHHKKYLNSFGSISYENCKDNLADEFKKINRFFKIKEPVNIDRLNECLKKTSKKNLISKCIDKKYFNNKMLNSNYEIKRGAFHEKYGKQIYNELNWSSNEN